MKDIEELEVMIKDSNYSVNERLNKLGNIVKVLDEKEKEIKCLNDTINSNRTRMTELNDKLYVYKSMVEGIIDNL